MENKNINTGLLLLRIGVGLLFIYAGLGKLIGTSIQGPGLEMFSGMVWGSMIVAIIVALVELIAGFMILIGHKTKIAALLITIIMLGATLIVAIPGGKFMGILQHLLFILVPLSLYFTGAGKKSIDKE